MYDCYYNALFVHCPLVLGRQMQPISMGHALLLIAIKSPVLSGDFENALRADILPAIYICSMPYADAVAKIKVGEFESDCKAWGESVSLLGNETAEFDAFLEYFKEHIKFPPRYEYISKGGKIIKPEEGAVPWPFTIAWALMERMTEDRAWNMPLPLAFAYHAANCQFHGDEFLVKEPKPVKDDA
jgi:hypothetical protein